MNVAHLETMACLDNRGLLVDLVRKDVTGSLELLVHEVMTDLLVKQVQLEFLVLLGILVILVVQAARVTMGRKVR